MSDISNFDELENDEPYPIRTFLPDTEEDKEDFLSSAKATLKQTALKPLQLLHFAGHGSSIRPIYSVDESLVVWSDFSLVTLSCCWDSPPPYKVEHPKITVEPDMLERIDQVCNSRTLSGGKELLRGALFASYLHRKRKEARNLIDSYTIPIVRAAKRAFAEWKAWRATAEEQRNATAPVNIFTSLIVLLLPFVHILVVPIRNLLAEVSTYRSVLNPRRRDDVYQKKRVVLLLFLIFDVFVPTFQTQRRVQRLQLSI